MKRLTEKEYEGYDDLNDDHYFVEYGVDLIDLPIIEDEVEVDFVGHDPVVEDDLFRVDHLGDDEIEFSVNIRELKVLGLDKDYIQLVFYDNDSWAYAWEFHEIKWKKVKKRLDFYKNMS